MNIKKKIDNFKKLPKKKILNSFPGRLKLSIILLMISGILFAMGKAVPGFSDMYYKYIYFILQNSVCRLFSVLPFSVYEVILIGFALYIVYRISRYSLLILKGNISISDAAKESLINILMYIAVFISLNVVSQSVNCFKTSFVAFTGIEIHDVNEEELIEVCEILRDKLNMLDEKILKNEEGRMALEGDTDKKGIENMKKLSQKYPCLNGFYPNPKHYLFSEIMSYQLLQGETTFTMEANYNDDMPENDIPATICHELSHIQGFNNENEANFISFLACSSSDSYEYQYSGYLMAYIYCINDLYRFNEGEFKKVNSSLSENVKDEMKFDSMFWNQYRGGISKAYSRIYDFLLKAGGQPDGIKSYNGVVKLLISSYGEEWY